MSVNRRRSSKSCKNCHELFPAMKIALIGAGYFARFQADAWRRIPEVELVAIVDPAIEKAAEFAKQFHIPRVFPSVAEMLAAEHPKLVDIATRPESHLEL